MWRRAAPAPAARTTGMRCSRRHDCGTGARRRRRNERRPGDSRLAFGRTTPPPTPVSSNAASRSRPSVTPVSSAARAILTSSIRWAWRASSPSCGWTCRPCARACSTTASRTRARPPRTSAACSARDPVPGRGRHQARTDPVDHARGAPGGELPQDAAGDGARHPRHPHQARRPRRQHADARAHAARQAGAHRARDPGDLRAARQPPRYPVDEGELEDLAFQYLEPEDYASRWRACRRRPARARRTSRRSSSGSTTALAEAEIKAQVLGPRQAPLVDPAEDEADRPRRGADLRHHRVPRDHRIGARLLRRARRRALELDAGAGALQGLHRAAQAQPVPVAAHDGDRPARRADGGADPHAGDAPDRRSGHRRALAVQGGREKTPLGSRTARPSPGCGS